MALTTIPLPYGIRDIRITPYTDSGQTLGTPLDLPYGRTLSFAEAEDFEELRGDDGVITTRGKGPSVDWDMEGGGVRLEIVRAMYGGTVNESGVTPNQIKTYKKLSTDARPFFKAEGQSISDSGGDVHVVLYRNRCTKDLKGEFADGSFFLYGAGGVTLPSLYSGQTNWLYDFVQNETATAIPLS